MNLLVLFGPVFLVLLVKNVKSKVLYNTYDGLSVETNVGVIRGVRAEDGNYNKFMGIPFGKVNESYVFGSASPYPPFEGVFEANDDSAVCPQIEEFNFTTVGSLDCLHLNVYVPDSDDSNLPVMVYIYGGGFNIGFGGRFLYGPEYIVRHGVILVTINYRLGPYGFMCLNHPDAPGNAGLKDQVLALRWIQANIGAFGGDSNKVTVFGNSAGGMSIGLHMVSENEKLFSGAIMQSGSPFLTSVIGDPNPTLLLGLSAALGLTTQDINAALEYVSNADPHSIVEASAALSIPVGPCIENAFPGEERFLTQRPINADHSKASDIAVLLGFNSEEMLSVISRQVGNPQAWLQWRNAFTSIIQNNFNFEEDQQIELSNIVRRLYVGDEEFNDDISDRMLKFMSDSTFVYPTIRGIKYYLNAGTPKVYQYLFSHDGKRNFVKVKDNISAPGVAHADEIGYLFKMEFIPGPPVPEDQLIIDRMTTMWTNFAKYGDPTPQITTLLPVKWEPITKGSPYHYLDIGTTLSAERRYEHKRMTFWDLFYEAYKENEVGFLIRDEDDGEEDEEEDGGEDGGQDGGEDGEEEGEEDGGEDGSTPDSANVAYLSPIIVLAVILNIFN